MKVLVAARIAKRRFDRRNWRRDPAGWRKVIRNVKKLCELRGITEENYK